MATYKIQTGLRLEEEMHAKMTFIAQKKRRSLNAQLEILVQNCIEEYEREAGEIEINIDDKPLH